MASSSSSLNWAYDVFLSFRGADIRSTFLSHFLKELDRKLITAFKDNEISLSPWPELVQAIRTSRIAVVIFSKNYASSRWCLNELLEIVNCNDNIVIPVFYGLDPSHVRNQTGDFGMIFQETCKKNTEEMQNQWKKALTDVANMGGYHSETWHDEAKLIEVIVNDVKHRLVPIISHRYSTGMAFLVVINLLLEIASAVSDQLSSIRKPYFARISLVMSILSGVLSILDLTYKIRAHKARFRCKWPIPWFYYPARGYRRIFGNFTDTVLLFCAVSSLITSTVNCIYIQKRREGPIKVSLWPLFFAIGMAVSKFMEKPIISKND